MTVCRFFQQGRCSKGETCSYEHPSPANTWREPPPKTLRIDAPSFQPANHSVAKAPCIFFQRGKCTNGALCRFGHEIQPKISTQQPPDARATTPCIFYQKNSCLKGQACPFSHIREPSGFDRLDQAAQVTTDQSTRIIGGATVSFGDGASISAISLPSDFSVVSISNVPHHLSVQELATSMNELGPFKITPVSIQMRSIPATELKTAQITMPDPKFAEDVLQSIGTEAVICGSTVRLSKGQIAGVSTTGFNRVQLASVSCSWNRPTHILTAKQLEEKVKAILERYGTLVDWVLITSTRTPKAKVIAKFAEPESARLAVKEVNWTTLDSKSANLLHVAPIVSVKMSISQRIFTSVKLSLGELSERAWKDHYVSVKTYENPNRPFTQIRIWGQEKKFVSQVKASVEKMLAGRVAVDDKGKQIIDPFFFKTKALPFFEAITKGHQVTIIPDASKHVLRLYGESENIAEAQRVMTRKIIELAAQTHILILDQKTFPVALKGGFHHILAKMGKERVKMEVSSGTKQIVVTGSEKDFEEVQTMLQAVADSPLEDQLNRITIDEEGELCPVCWTPPEDPFKTTCNHIYCRSCLASQCSSATSCDIPLTCLGDSATCHTILTLAELAQALSPDEYEVLFNLSVNSYIKTRPFEFRFCPTPDCSYFYRCSSKSNPRVFDCDSCLASTCTLCHCIAHDGLSCEASEAALIGTKEFAKWKKDNDVRDCPKCSAGIEKNEGCNHMQCLACKVHICWFCMRTFDTGPATYGHMQKAHSSFV